MIRTLLAASSLALPASVAAATGQPVTIAFKAQIGSSPFQCGRSYPGVGAPATTITPTDMRFYVSNVALVDAAGRRVPVALDQDGVWQYRDIALLDFEDGSGPCRQGGNAGLNATVKGHVPPGKYVGLAFDMGLPFDLDHGDATIAPSPLNSSAMFWAWAPGYRFVKVDLLGAAAPMPAMAGMPGMAAMPGMANMRQTGFALHIGSTGCDGRTMTSRPARCAQPNVVKVVFARFDPARDKIVFDMAAALAATDFGHNAPNTPPGCMGDQADADCKPIFAAFGLPFGGVAGKEQRVFRIMR